MTLTDYKATQSRIMTVLEQWLKGYELASDKDEYVKEAETKGLFHSLERSIRKAPRTFALKVKLMLKDIRPI